MLIDPFRVTPEDLPDLPKNVREGLVPLLEALNKVLGQVVTGLATLRTEWPTEGFFTSDINGAAIVDVTPVLAVKPSSAALDWLRLADGSQIASPYSFSWTQLQTGPRLLFVGLSQFTKYSFRVTIK